MLPSSFSAAHAGAVPAYLSVYQQLQYLSRVCPDLSRLYPAPTPPAHPSYTPFNPSSLLTMAMAPDPNGVLLQPSPSSLLSSPCDPTTHPRVTNDARVGVCDDDNWDDDDDDDSDNEEGRRVKVDDDDDDDDPDDRQANDPRGPCASSSDSRHEAQLSRCFKHAPTTTTTPAPKPKPKPQPQATATATAATAQASSCPASSSAVKFSIDSILGLKATGKDCGGDSSAAELKTKSRPSGAYSPTPEAAPGSVLGQLCHQGLLKGGGGGRGPHGVQGCGAAAVQREERGGGGGEEEAAAGAVGGGGGELQAMGDDQSSFPWLQCTRYHPPKLQREYNQSKTG